MNIKKINSILPSTRKSSKRIKCIVCSLWVNKEVKDCQPCIGSRPPLSMLHKFNETYNCS